METNAFTPPMVSKYFWVPIYVLSRNAGTQHICTAEFSETYYGSFMCCSALSHAGDEPPSAKAADDNFVQQTAIEDVSSGVPCINYIVKALKTKCVMIDHGRQCIARSIKLYTYALSWI